MRPGGGAGAGAGDGEAARDAHGGGGPAAAAGRRRCRRRGGPAVPGAGEHHARLHRQGRAHGRVLLRRGASGHRAAAGVAAVRWGWQQPAQRRVGPRRRAPGPWQCGRRPVQEEVGS